MPTFITPPLYYISHIEQSLGGSYYEPRYVKERSHRQRFKLSSPQAGTSRQIWCIKICPTYSPLYSKPKTILGWKVDVWTTISGWIYHCPISWELFLGRFVQIRLPYFFLVNFNLASHWSVVTRRGSSIIEYIQNL